MKGFLFSIEALFAVAVIIAVISIFWSINSVSQNPQNSLMLQVQSGQTATQYFNYNTNETNPLAQTQVCQKIIYYNFLTKTVAEKTVCGAIQ